jgi:hypothetical protein
MAKRNDPYHKEKSHYAVGLIKQNITYVLHYYAGLSQGAAVISIP